MQEKKPGIALRSFDNLFSTEESRSDEQLEKIQTIPLTELHPFHNHPFKVINDERMRDLVDSIKEHGILMPAIVRPRSEGGYEMVSGHRRHMAAGLAELTALPALVRELDDDAATIIMVDSNIQREHILPSERAYAYKMKLDAIKRQGKRNDLSSGQMDPMFDARRSNAIVAEQVGESVKQLQRYIRLTELISPLLDRVDDRRIAFHPAVELSYLRPAEQTMFLEIMDSEQSPPTLSQAQRLKRFSQEGTLTKDVMHAIVSESKKGNSEKLTLPSSVLNKYFSKSDTPQQMQDTIIAALEMWHKAQQHQS